MSAIKATWTGNGVPDGTDINGSNVAASGNSVGPGVSWAFARDGSAYGTTSGDGVAVTGEDRSQFQIRATLDASSAAMRGQVLVTAPASLTASWPFIQAYNISDANQGWVRFNETGQIELYRTQIDMDSRSPALPTGARALVDVVYHQGETAARMFYRVTNIGDPGWNNGEPFFYDTGYTLPHSTNYGRMLFGKVGYGTALTGAGGLIERLGVEAITVDPADTSQAAAEAYFADEPGDPLATPVVTITATTDPTGPSATDGTITATWEPIAGADHYEAGIASGDVDDGYTTTSTDATSPYTWTGLSGGTYTVAVRAIP